MKKITSITLLFAAAAILCAFTVCRQGGPEKQASVATEKIKWYTWNEAMQAMKKEPRKIIIDVYTDWCGWCKVMDQKTFPVDEVATYIGKNFYPVKFNAEQREDIFFNNHTFKYIPSGNRGVHELAYSLLDGRMGYPSIVYLNEKMERILISPGYKEPAQLMKELKFTAEEHYKTKKWEEFQQQ